MASNGGALPDLKPPLQALLRASLLEVCPDEVGAIDATRSAVTATKKEGRGDYTCRVATAVFRKLRAKASATRRRPPKHDEAAAAAAPLASAAAGAAQEDGLAELAASLASTSVGPPAATDGAAEDLQPAATPTPTPPTPPPPTPLASTNAASVDAVTVTTTSEYGVVRVRHFASAAELAQALVEALPEGSGGGGSGSATLVADARVDPDGVILICTQRHLQRQRCMGQLYCADCGHFFAGDRGLRNHQLVKHGRDYEASMECVKDSQRQLVAFTCDRSLITAWTDEAAAQRRARDELGDPGLEAARAGDLASLQDLVASGWDPHRAADRHGSNALLWAAGEGHLEVCKYLADACKVPAVALGGPTKKRQRNALHWAARNGHLEVVHWLVVEQQVPVDLGTSDGTTAFMYAVWMGKMPVARWLADPDKGACNFGSTNSFGCNAVQWCAQTGDIPMCEFLLEIGLDLRLKNRNRHSALHKAAVKGQQGACEWLLGPGGLGLDHMCPDTDGNTPAEMARLEGFAELAAWLEEKTRELELEGKAEAEAEGAGQGP